MSRTRIRVGFPRLNRTPFFLTSPATPQYNCIAWAVGDERRWWWPVSEPHREAYWPAGVARRVEISTFIAAFATLGYEPCPSADLEPGFEKVALFADPHGTPTHAAKQLGTGRWSSKLGPEEDIDHSIYGLEGGVYGTVVQYIRRPIPRSPLER